MTIVRATYAHLNQLVKLEKDCFGDDCYSEAMLKSDIENDNYLVFVAVEGDEVVGYIDVFHMFDEANLIKIAVAPAKQKSGIGTNLLVCVVAKLKELGVTKLYLEVSCNNQTAIKFYQKHNFLQTTIRKKYYNDLSDAIIMTKFF